MPHFKAKKRLSDGANANRARDSLGSKCNAAADAATPDSPDVITVVEYYPRPVRGKGSKRADPGPDDPTVEWSPISWLDGAQGFAKWL